MNKSEKLAYFQDIADFIYEIIDIDFESLEEVNDAIISELKRLHSEHSLANTNPRTSQKQ